MKRLVTFSSVVILIALSFALVRPAIASGLFFDYAEGGHSVSIEYGQGNYASWGASTDELTTSFSLDGSGSSNGHEPFPGQVSMTAISNASAAFGNASLGTMGVRAEAVDPSGTVSAAVEVASAHVHVGGAFIIAGPIGTVDLNVRTTLDGIVGVTLQPGISERSLLSFEMSAASQDYTPGNYWTSSTGWDISSRSGEDQGGNPYQDPGLYLGNDRISSEGAYEFINYELILTLAGVRTNQLFNLDLLLDAEIAGPGFSFYGTTGDRIDFFSTYGLGFTSGNDPQRWFELPEGYSIATAPVPEPETWAMLLTGLGLMGWLARQRRSGFR